VIYKGSEPTFFGREGAYGPGGYNPDDKVIKRNYGIAFFKADRGLLDL